MKAIQNSGVPLVGAFVGNKCEFRDGSIDSRAEVDILEAKETAESLGMTYFETSAVSLRFVLFCTVFVLGEVDLQIKSTFVSTFSPSVWSYRRTISAWMHLFNTLPRSFTEG